MCTDLQSARQVKHLHKPGWLEKELGRVLANCYSTLLDK